MKQEIDHAIAIPHHQTAVWAIVGNLDNNAQWQVDCTELSYLNAYRQQKGTRFRKIDTRGRAYIIEITAWYDGLGYEYTVVDGAAYQENRGRIRLQETPDGTIVQWTFTYEPSGLLSGLTNRLSTRRRLDHQITEGLRNLYHFASEAGTQFDVRQSRSLMRDAPDAESRASYQSRYETPNPFAPVPSFDAEADQTPTSLSDSQALRAARNADQVFERLMQEEPALADGDTPVNPALVLEPLPGGTSASISQPDRPAAQPTDSSSSRESLGYRDNADSVVPQGSPATATDPGSDASLSSLQESQSPASAYQTSQPISWADDPVAAAAPEPDVVDTASTEVPAPEPSRPVTSDAQPRPDSPAPAPDIAPPARPATEPVMLSDDMDTAKISVFDVFGLQRPSQSDGEPTRAAATPPAERSDETPAAQTPSQEAEPPAESQPVAAAFDSVVEPAAPYVAPGRNDTADTAGTDASATETDDAQDMATADQPLSDAVPTDDNSASGEPSHSGLPVASVVPQASGSTIFADTAVAMLSTAGRVGLRHRMRSHRFNVRSAAPNAAAPNAATTSDET